MPSAMSFLVFLGAMTFLVGELCFFAYDSYRADQRLRRRVDLLPSRRGATDRANQLSRRLAATADRLATRRLRGNELEFARRLARWHTSNEHVPWLYLAVRCLAMILLTAIALFVVYRFIQVREATSLIATGALGIAAGWFVPDMIVRHFASHRRQAIANALPEALELLVIAIETGLSLEDALDRIVAELRGSQPAIAEELALTSVDLKMLPGRDAALQRLAERVGSPSVQSVTTILTQSLAYGTPLADALRTVAAELRNDALIRLEERANQMPALLTIPMILFILPSLF